MLALTIASSVYGLELLHSHSLCGDFQSLPFSHGAPGAPSLPGFHSTGITTVPQSSPFGPGSQSILSSIHQSLSPGISVGVDGVSLYFQIQEHHIQSWSGYLTISR